MFLHPIGVSLAESFNLVSDVEIISDVPRCVDNDFEVSEIFVVF